MIRTVWATLMMILSTFSFGSIAMVAALVGIRGALHAWCTRHWSRVILWASGVRVRVHGLEHLPRDRGRIVVANHLSFYDIFALAAVIPGVFHFVGKKELGKIPFFGIAWRAAGHIALDRSNRQRALESLEVAAERIREGEATIILFPEGTRSRSGRLQPLKRGAFHLARASGVPLVPTAIVGSFDILQPDRWRIHPATIEVHFEEPIDPTGGESDPTQIQQRVRDAIAARLEAEGYDDPAGTTAVRAGA